MPNDDEIILKGSYYGVKKFKKFKKFDIIKSVILGNTYEKNELALKKKRGNKIFAYHTFDFIMKKKYGGRWYSRDLLNPKKIKLNRKEHILTYIIPEWEMEDDPKYHVVKNVPIKIYFTDKGWDKFILFIED